MRSRDAGALVWMKERSGGVQLAPPYLLYLLGCSGGTWLSAGNVLMQISQSSLSPQSNSVFRAKEGHKSCSVLSESCWSTGNA